MALSWQSRRVGDISVVQCSGRIVEGSESRALKAHLDELLPLYPHVILNLDGVDFIDSGGLGLLVRLLARAHGAHGELKLCAVRPRIGEVLRVTKLQAIFDSHESEADAVAAFYQPAKPGSPPQLFHTDILCVDPSDDVLMYVRQVLGQEGYHVVTTNNLPDALALLKAMRPKLVVVSAALRSTTGTQTADTFNRLADARAVIELPGDFSSHDAGDAGRQLLDRVRVIV